MALINNYKIIVFDKEINFPQAYHKVDSLFATNKEIKVNVSIYNDSSKTHLIDYASFQFGTVMDVEPDLIQLAYKLIKTLPEYEGAFDVFEEEQPVK